MTLVDAVLPAYNEPPDAVEATVDALARQTHPLHRIILVDDASQRPLQWGGRKDIPVSVLRMPRNGGISAARNAGIRASDAPFVACVNIDVLPDEDWIAVCLRRFEDHPEAGAVAARTIMRDPATRLGQWRSLVQEPRYPQTSGTIPWAIGHATLFRRSVLEQVGGFDERLQRAGEDVDIGYRMAKQGWEVHFVSETSCRSIQEDSLRNLANAEYNRFCWTADSGNGFLRGMGILTARGMLRSGIHTVRGNWRLIPVEMGIWYHGARIAWKKR